MRAPSALLAAAIELATACAPGCAGEDGPPSSAPDGAGAPGGAAGERAGSNAAAGSAGAATNAGASGANAMDAASARPDGAACDGPCAEGGVADMDAASAGPDSGGSGDAAACTPCAEYGEPVLLANVGVAELAELSGIAASTRNPGVLFAHNDRARAVVYALGEDGALRGRFTMADSNAVDVEDLAVGPCPAGSCLYLADIGGNISPRTEYAILRSAEPELPSSASAPDTTVEHERFRFRYDDGANHNAEGLLVEPRSGAVYVVTKVADGQPSSVYRLPNPLLVDQVNVATRVVELPVPRAGGMAASAAAAHPCGAGFLVRTYDAVHEFRIAPGAPFEDAFAAEPTTLTAGDEPQSEGITYLPDGRGFVSAGEGAGAPIFRSACR
jgi:hypothetical protein